MINVYDTAHLLASQLKESEEYKEYKRLKDIAFEDGTNRTLLEELKRLQFRMQAKAAGGEKPDEEEMQKLMRISSLLQLNSDASAYIMAEFRFQKLIADIYKIIGDAAGIDIDALTQA
ncbi:MAG: YlbF family regulator [Clostridia bacterium]|nr:YlbF family regulator [Clostridia bacterium]